MCRTTFDADVSGFVGRELEKARLSSFLDGTSRVFTIVGPGGAGKTRLSRHFLHQLENWDRWFCDLSGTRSLEEIVATISRTLQVTVVGQSLEEAIEHLGRSMARERRAVIVLDNFEQVIQHAHVVATWRLLAPDAWFIVTSRERLGIDAEEVFEISPLSEDESLQLFERRTRSVRPGWTMRPEERDTVTEICRQLDWSPLAIELAAARMEVLSATDLLDRLSRRFELLRRARPVGVTRHASLRAAIDWSWDLLSPVEQEALAQLSVFQGTFPFSAVEAVLKPSDPDASILDLVQSLRRMSLLRVRSIDQGLEFRLALDVSVREYAAERLTQSGQRDAIEERHAMWFLTYAEHWADKIFGDDGAVRFHRIETELDNIRPAYVWSLSGRPEVTARFAAAVYEMASARGRHLKIARVLREGLSSAEQVGDNRLLTRVLIAHLTEALVRQGRSDVGADVARAIAAAEATGEPKLLIRVLHMASVHAERQGQADESMAHLERALAIAMDSESRACEASTRRLLAGKVFERGQLDAARDHLQRALVLCRALDFRELLGRILYNLAILERARGSNDAARDYTLQALELQSRLGNRTGEADALKHLGLIDLDAQRLDEARDAFQRSLALYRKSGDRIHEAVMLRNQANLAFVEDQLADAEKLYRASLLIHLEMNEPRMEGFVVVQLGLLACVRAEYDEADEWLTKAKALFERVPDSMGQGLARLYRGVLDLARDRESDAEKSFAAGRRLLEAAGARQMLPMVDAFEALLQLDADRDAVRQRLEVLEGAISPAHSFHVRFALNHLRRRLLATESSPPHQVMALASDGSAFRVNGDVVDLSRRRPLRLLMQRLGEQHRSLPGKPLSLDELLTAGWPGEKILNDAGIRRIRVAMSTLRGMGLGDILVTRHNGYMLNPKVGLAPLTAPL